MCTFRCERKHCICNHTDNIPQPVSKRSLMGSGKRLSGLLTLTNVNTNYECGKCSIWNEFHSNRLLSETICCAHRNVMLKNIKVGEGLSEIISLSLLCTLWVRSWHLFRLSAAYSWHHIPDPPIVGYFAHSAKPGFSATWADLNKCNKSIRFWGTLSHHSSFLFSCMARWATLD